MNTNEPLIPGLVRQSLREPRAAARAVIGSGVPAPILWEALALVVVLSTILAQVTTMLTPSEDALAGDPMMPLVLYSPMLLGVIQGCLLVMMVFAVHWVGRTFGGRGAFEGALAVVVWLQFLLVCLQVVQTLAMVILPGLGGLIAIVGVVLFFWLLTQFVCVLHGFESAGMVFVMILVSMLALTFALSILLSIVGILFMGASPNV